MKLKLSDSARRIVLGLLLASGVFTGAVEVSAQSSVDGSWNTNGGSWGNFTLTGSPWSFAQPMRPANVVPVLNVRATAGTINRVSNAITTITVGNPGSGYTSPPTVIITGGNGVGARAYATINGAGEVTQIVVTNGGSGYTATPTVTISGEIASFDIVDPGSGYSVPPRIAFSGGGAYTSVPTVTFVGGNGSGAVATATVSGGQVTGFNISNGGSGYGAPPAISLTGGGGSGATASATVSGGVITSIQVVSGGSGYSSSPTVGFVNNTATGTAVIVDGRLTQIELTNPGAGYTSAPRVDVTGGGATGNGGSYVDAVIEDGSVTSVLVPGNTGNPPATFPLGGASGAEAVATLAADGSLASLTLVQRGQGYVSAPSAVIGAPLIRTATAVSARSGTSISAINLTNSGAGYLTAPAVTIGTNGWQGYTAAPQVRFSRSGVTGAIATANRTGTGIGSVTVNYGGAGYSQGSPPTVGFVGGGGSGAAGTAVVNANGAVVGVTITNQGTGYTTSPVVTFTSGGVTHAVATSTFSAGRLSNITVVHPGAGYTAAPTVTFSGGIANGGVHATATPVMNGLTVASVTINTQGGAMAAAAVAVRAADGSLSAVNVTNAGTGYTLNPTITIAAPGGVVTPTQLAPGGVGSYVHFNNNIGANSTITLDAARTVGSFSIGDWINAEDFALTGGTGGITSSLTFDMGAIGGGQSFLQKLQGDQDSISVPLYLSNQLNARINTGRLTLSGGVSGPGSLVTSGNAILTVTGVTESSTVDLWLWNRGTTNNGAQVELGSTDGPAFNNIRLGSASRGDAGYAVLQLLQGRGGNQLDQIQDNATILADGVTNRWTYFKLMGGDETIGNILDIGNALVIENMEGETVNTDAVLTLGGNNLDSYVGGFIRNRSGGSGTGTQGITKLGTGALTLFGGNITYTGQTTLLGGQLRLINAGNFASTISAAAGTSILLDAQAAGNVMNFNDPILGAADIRKVGLGVVNFSGGETILDNLSVDAGSVSFLPGPATLRGGRNEIRNDFTAISVPGLSRNVTIGAGLSVGGMQVDGLYGQIGSNLVVSGTTLSMSNMATFVDGVLESSGPVTLSNTSMVLGGNVNTLNKRVVNTSTNAFITLNDANNVIVGSVLTLAQNLSSAANRKIPQDTRVVAVNLVTRVVELSKTVNIVAGTDVTFTYSNQTDGAFRGESLNFADVVFDGRKYVAVTARGGIHTSLNSSFWDQVYSDPSERPLRSVQWTGAKFVAVGDQGRVLTSATGDVWTEESSGFVQNLNSVTSTTVSLTGATTVGNATVTGVTNGTSYPVGALVHSFAVPPDARIASVTVNGSDVTVVLDSPAQSTATNVNFGYFRGNTTSGSTTVSNVRTAQTLLNGLPISGAGIPNGVTISDFDGPASTVTMNQNASANAAGVILYTLAGNTSLNSKTVSGLTNTQGLVVGMTLRGNSIAPGSVITAINAGAGTLTLSLPAVANGNSVPLSVFTGRTVSGSPILQDVTSAGSFTAGMPARGVIVEPGTYVSSNTASTLVLSQPVQATAAAAPLVAARTALRVTGNFSLNSSTVTGVSLTSGLVAGMPVSAPGIIPPNTVIQSVGAGSIVLSKEALGPFPGAEFFAGFNLVAVGESGIVLGSVGGASNTWAQLPSPASSESLNAVSWSSGSVLVAAGGNGLLARSTTGLTWARQTPPLTDAQNVILGFDATTRQMTLNNNALTAGSNVSFDAFKGSTAANSAIISNVSGMHALRPGMYVFSTSGIQAGTTVRSVNEAAFSMVLSASATTTLAAVPAASQPGAPIQTFQAVSKNGSSEITEVSDFKGLMPGMALHGTALPSPRTIVALDIPGRRIFLAGPANQSTRAGFGVLYGDMANGSATITNIRLGPFNQTLGGASAHLVNGRPLSAVSGFINAATTVTSYNVSTNQMTFAGTAAGTGDIPLLTFTGLTTNGSNIIEGVSAGSFAGLSNGMQIYITGAADGTSGWSNNTFTITGLNSAGGTITLSSAPALNATGDATTVAMGVYTGRVTSGQNTVTNISNRLGELPPIVFQPDMRDVFWTGSQFVAVGDYGALYVSADGTSWSMRNTGTGRDLYSVGLSGTRLLAAGENGLILASTDSGANWTVVRAADSPALNDVRSLDTVRSLVTAGGRTLALGNGGLATTDAASWSTSVNDTFSGTSTTLSIAGRVGGGGGIELRNEVTTSATTDPANGPLVNRNNSNRIGNSVTLESKGGLFVFNNNMVNSTFAETVGQLLLSQGQLQVQTTRAGTSGTSTLTFDSLKVQPGATIDFLGRENTSGVLVTSPVGTIGEGANAAAIARNRILFSQTPVLDDGILGGWATIENEWATYDTNLADGQDGVKRLPASAYNTGDQNTWIASNNVKMTAGRTLAADRVINSLNMQGQTLSMGGKRLSIESGGLLVHTGTATISGSGALTVGAGRSDSAVLNIINSAQLNLSTVITDFIADITTSGAVSAGANVVTLGNVVGLTVGMEVSGLGAAAASVAQGSRIVSINTNNNQVTLSVPLSAALANSSQLRFTGGSVSLAKSGTGLLVLGGTNNYSGKTFINNGIVQLSILSSLGRESEAFEQDRIQINGGTLRITHVTSGTPPLEDYNLSLNDGKTGLTIGAAGGRIEVGTAIPNNNNPDATPVPQINFTIANPINATGVLELAVLANGGLNPPQTNSIILGTPSSTNTYRAGIKTEGGFEGLVMIRGNNSIGGIFSEAGKIILEGNNDFTAPIRAQIGDVTILGSNTWRGSNNFTETLVMLSGTLKLGSASALGTAGLNLDLANTTVSLMGISQSIRQINGTANTVINNNGAPDSISSATPVYFDLSRNQTYAGSLRNGLTVSGNKSASLKLVKRGPGTLTLTNATSNFTGGIEIQQGAIEVNTLGNVFDVNSSLGAVSSSNPSLFVIDKGALIVSPTAAQSTDRSFTMGTGPNGATIAANGTIRAATVTLGNETRDIIAGTSSITAPIAFKDAGPRTLTLSGTGVGDNRFQIELGDKSASEPSSLFKAGTGRWLLSKAAPYSGLTTVQNGTLAITKNDALGTAGEVTTVSGSTFTGNYPDGTPVSFPLFAATTLPLGIRADTQYYVVESTGSTFKVAATPGGTAITLTSAGSNVKVSAKIDNFRSTSYSSSGNRFTGLLPNGAQVIFNTKSVPGVTPVLPGGLLTNTTYYVVNSAGGSFQIATDPAGTNLVTPTSEGTPDTLYYVTDARGNNGAGVNLVSGTLELGNVNYLATEDILFEGGFMSVPANASSSWAGNLFTNAPARITIGTGGVLNLGGNMLGYHGLNQEGEGTLVFSGEMLAPSSVASNNREWAVRAGTLVLDYGLNNSSKLADNANLRLGGSRRGGTLILRGGSHEEVVLQTVLEAGASKIFRESGAGTIRLNNLIRGTGSSLYVDSGRIAKVDQPNNTNGILGSAGILGSWAIIRDAIVNAYWVIPGSTERSYDVTADPVTNQVLTSTNHVVTRGSVVRFSSTGELPGGLMPDTPYFAVDCNGANRRLLLATSMSTGAPRIDLTSAGAGTITMTVEQGFQANAAQDLFTTAEGHGLANGLKVRVKSYGILPQGLMPDTDYYVVRAESLGFRLSTLPNGQPVNISTNGSGAHVIQTQGAGRRAGPAALTFSVNQDFFPGSDGNDRIRVAIQHVNTTGAITSTLTGQGTLGDPYVYTVFTTNDFNTTNDLVAFVNGDNVGGLPVSDILKAQLSPSLPSGTLYPDYTRIADTGSYGAPTALANGTFDDGRQDLSWAKNAGLPGSSTTLNDGFIMPYDSYGTGWDSNVNSNIVGDLNLAALRNTFSVRFANQIGATVSLLFNGVHSIRSGGILVSPTVGSNDSTIGGTGRLTTENQGNLQNFILQQHNDLGSLVINNSITDRAAINRSGYLTADIRRNIYLSDLSGLAVGWTVTGTGITNTTTIAEVDVAGGKIVLNRDTDNSYRGAISYTFTSPDSSQTITRQGVYSNPGRRIIAGISNISAPNSTGTAGLEVGMTVTGAGVAASTTIEEILDGHAIRLSRDHDGGYRRADYTFSGGTLGAGSTTRRASTTDNYRRRVIGMVKPSGAGNPVSMVTTTDLYVGMPIRGPGIPFGSFISFIFNESDIEVSTNHFYTGDKRTMTFTPSVGLEKLGSGVVALNGTSDYTGVTFIADGTIRAGRLTDGGVPGSLGASSAASSNLVFNGGTLQYVGDNNQTNRGFTVADFARLNIGHEKTQVTFSGAIASGQDRLEKDGPGTLVLNGNANLAAIRVMQGKLLLQAIDTNAAPSAFSPSNFATGNLTQLVLSGGILEARGTPEGSVAQTLGTQMVIESGASKVVATSVAGFDPNNLVDIAPIRNMTLNLMGQEELSDVLRYAGGTVHFVENPEKGGGAANILMMLETDRRQRILPWATYEATNSLTAGVNQFATVSLSTGDVVSAGDIGLYSTGSRFQTPGGWESERYYAKDVSPSEVGDISFNGTATSNRFANVLRYSSQKDGEIIIEAGRTIELVNGAILVATSVQGAHKSISGPGNLTGGAQNAVNSDFILHNYNTSAPFSIGANIVDRMLISAAITSPTFGLGTLKEGEVQMKVAGGVDADFYNMVRPGMDVSGPGIQPGTQVAAVESIYRRIILSLPALSDQVDQVYTFKDVVNFIQAGTGTTILSGTNTYSGNTYVNGGVLRLDSANAVPGGISASGGTSALIVNGGVIGLGLSDFQRGLGSGAHQLQFKGSGGFAAYGADRVVNIGGAPASEPLRFGNNGFVPDGSSLILGSHDATHKVTFANPIDLGSFSQAVRVQDSPIAVEAELGGELSGLGRLIKFGLGTLRLGVSNNHSGGIEVAEGRLVAANVPNVFGQTVGSLKIGTSLTNTSTEAAVEVVVEGGTIANKIEVGSINASAGPWKKGGKVDNTQGAPNVGQEMSAAVVSGYPAVAYYDVSNQDLKYVRALDPRGTAWGIPVTVASRGVTGRHPSLSIINGNPAVTFYDETAGMLLYSRSNDAQGVVWGTPVTLLGASVPVLAVAVQPDGKVLVGGSFTRFDGQPTKPAPKASDAGYDPNNPEYHVRSRLVRLNQDGSVDTSFKAYIMNGEVRSILVMPDGKIFIGGTFTTVRQNKAADENNTNTTRNRLALLNADGSLDTSLNPDANGDVRVMVTQSDGKIMVGGSFTAISGATRTRLARLNSNGVLDSSFVSPDIRNNEVRAIVPEETGGVVDSYVIGGSFTSVRGDNNRNRLARIAANGASALAFNPDANNVVYDIIRLSSGKLLVGGAFTAFSGGNIARTRLARLNSDGSVDESFAQEVDNEVRDMHLQSDGSVLLAGVFTNVGGINRNYAARLLTNDEVDASFNPDPDFEVRSMTTLADDKIVIGGMFTQIGGQGHQMVGRLLASGAADSGFNARRALDWGRSSSLAFINGAPAIAFQDVVNKDVYYVRSTDVNGVNWPNAELVEASGDVGSTIALGMSNIGGDLFSKNDQGNQDTTDDTIFVTGTGNVANVANIGTPAIVFTDATNASIRYTLALNVNANALAAPLTNWFPSFEIPGTSGKAGDHLSFGIVQGRPTVAYQDQVSKTLKYVRASHAAGFNHNLRDPDTFELFANIKVSELVLTPAWSPSVTIDSATDVGAFPSLALVTGLTSSTAALPAVSYYDVANGDLKFVAAADVTGASWGAPSTLASLQDVGQATTLMMTDGLPAVTYYNATAGEIDFLVMNKASGYSRMTFTADTTLGGAVQLGGTTILSPAAGATVQMGGVVGGDAGFRLVGQGVLSLLNAANSFGASLAQPGVTTGPGAAVNGSAILRSGTLLAGASGALGLGTVELGDAIPREVTVDRATATSITRFGGSFDPQHDGENVTTNGPGAFLAVNSTIDGKNYGLRATTPDIFTNRFSGNLPNGTPIFFYSAINPNPIQGGVIYYVKDSNGTDFRVSASLGGPTVDVLAAGQGVFYIEASALSSQILVKDEAEHPERNGVYRVVITTDSLARSENQINLVRDSSMDTVVEMTSGSRVRVQAGSSVGKTFFVAGTPQALNLSAVHWVEDATNADISLLASDDDVTLGNAVDINSQGLGVKLTLGAASTVTSGVVDFTGLVTLQNQFQAAQELQNLSLTSSTSTGFGLRLSGVISEADGGVGATKDRLSLIKEGAGVATLSGNNTFSGGITINQGTLLVMNAPSPTASGTGTGTVQVNAGAVLGGTGSIGGAVNLAGAAGSKAVLRPGDPTSSSAAEELLTINQPLTVGANSVVEFTLGATNLTRLAGNSISLTTSTSNILVQLAPGYLPEQGREFDILDITGGINLFGGVSNLLNLLLLPVEKVWDTSRFISEGKIIAMENSEPPQVTQHPVSRTVQQGASVSFTVAYTGTGPISIQWMHNDVDIPGATSATYDIASARQEHEGVYKVRVMNPVNPSGAISNPATLQVDWPLSFAFNLPATKKGSPGDPVTFRVVMNGESPISYQWFKGTDLIPGESGPTYTINSVQPGDVGTYQVKVTGPFNPAPGLLSQVCDFSLSTGNAVVLDAPVSQTLLQGDDMVLTAQAGGDNNKRVLQWRRGATQLFGEDSSTLNVPDITLAQAGEYTFRVDNVNQTTGKPANATSAPAFVVVVENPGRIVAAQVGKSVKLTVNVGAPSKVKPLFRWRKNGFEVTENGFGGRFKGVATKTLSIDKLELTDSDVYTCEVTGAAGTSPVIGGTTYLKVYNQGPALVKTTPPDAGMVGAAYAWKIPVTSDQAPTTELPDPGLVTPQKYEVKGLPPGLKVDALTGWITGRPTAVSKSPSGYPVTIQVSNAVKLTTPEAIAAAKWDTVINIMALPAGVAGTYAGPVDRSALNQNLGGRFDMTVSSSGAISGKLTMGSDASRSFTGAFSLQFDNTGALTAAPAAEIFLAATKTAPALTLEFGLGITAPTNLTDPPVTVLSTPTITAKTGTVAFEAWRNNFGKTAVAGAVRPATEFVGLYNMAYGLETGDPLVGNDAVPQGAGFASFTVGSNGSYTLAGRTADNEKLTGAAWVGPEGQCFVFQTLYTTKPKGSLLGSFQITKGSAPSDNDISGGFDWVRPANPKSRLYKNGFGLAGMTVATPVALEVYGGFYSSTASTGTLFDLDPLNPGPVDILADLRFSEDGTFDDSIPSGGDVDTLTNPNLSGATAVTVRAGSKMDIPYVTALTKIAATKTGGLSGSFKLVDGTLKRSVSFQGLAVRKLLSAPGAPVRMTDVIGVGYFIIDQKPVGLEKPTTSPQESGIFLFQDR